MAERPLASAGQIEAALRAARAAQAEWARLAIAERARFCTAMVDAMLAMETEIVPELALQMGRPVRYGAGELKGFAEQAGVTAYACRPRIQGEKARIAAVTASTL